MNKFLLFFFFIIANMAFGQSEKPIHQWYSMSATEIIFSSNKTDATLVSPQLVSYSPSPVVRFTAFLHIQGQSHYNFSNGFGLYTGLGIRNVGIINHYDYKDNEISIKQRSYSLGVPLALKFGNVT